jgi:hypothetical protein
MENTLGRPSFPSTAMVQVHLSITRLLVGLARVLEAGQPTMTTTDLSEHMRHYIGLNPIFAIRRTSQPYTRSI